MGFTDQSTIDKDGWIKGGGGELLFWVPEAHRAALHRPSTVWAVGGSKDGFCRGSWELAQACTGLQVACRLSHPVAARRSSSS